MACVLNENKTAEYNFIFYSTEKDNIVILQENGINAEYIKINQFDRILAYLKTVKVIRFFINSIKLKLDLVFSKQDIDLVYFLTQSSLYRYLNDHNFIYTLWDLCHRDYPEFPEVSLNNEFYSREEHLLKLLPRATNIFTESELGKQNVIRRYGIDNNRVTVMPMVPSRSTEISEKWPEDDHISIKEKYSLKNEYIFYPAQFWSHKNHIYILEGIKILKEEFNISLDVIFSGSNKGNQRYIEKTAEEFGIINQLNCIGFVENKEIPYLYKQALALVMPTYFGPSNIPPLEASLYKCPIIYSDLDGLNEQMKNKALFIDLKNPRSLSENLIKIIKNDEEVNKLILNAYESIISSDTSEHWRKVKQVFDDYRIIQKTWKY